MNKILIFLILASISCGPTITKSPKLSENQSSYVALIPSKTVDGISRERLEYISELVKLNLESKGYVLITPETLQNTCIDLECSNIDEISGRYSIGKIAHINLESSSSIDFLAGYYSSLTGQFIVEDTLGKALYSALYTARDSGGLILESGQIIQAIINQIRNGDESSVDKVSYNFVKALLKEIPKAENAQAKSNTLSLDKIDLSKHEKQTTKLCAYGTPRQSAWLISSKKESTELKETKEGQYCGIFRLEGPWAQSQGLKVELKSPYGELVRLEISQ